MPTQEKVTAVEDLKSTTGRREDRRAHRVPRTHRAAAQRSAQAAARGVGAVQGRQEPAGAARRSSRPRPRRAGHASEGTDRRSSSRRKIRSRSRRRCTRSRATHQALAIKAGLRRGPGVAARRAQGAGRLAVARGAARPGRRARSRAGSGHAGRAASRRPIASSSYILQQRGESGPEEAAQGTSS